MGPGFVNPALLFCLNCPLQEPKAGGFPLGPCGLAEFLDDPRGFVSVPVLGSGRANRAHSRGEPRNRGSFGGQALHYPTLTWHSPSCQRPGSSLQRVFLAFPSSGLWVLGSSCSAQVTPSSLSMEGRGSPQWFISTVLGTAVVPEQPRLLGLYIGIVLALLVRSGFPALEMGELCGDPTSGSSRQTGSSCLMEHFGN